ncbi:MAG TPA: phage/plasmid primase, P4 family [Sphingobium sp.]|uniref:phage/plasmid primase, P4 family n=1 Tax=Sphingobium sp. TaxID=1912891 RepID=UPI002ED1E545
MSVAQGDNVFLMAALRYARSGWRVFPCRPRREEFLGRGGKPVILKEKEPLVGMDKDRITGEPIKGTGGLSKATTDEEQIRAWWRKWPDALIGALTGPGMEAFVVDFDVIDKKTGEVFVLAERIAALEEAIGCELPETAMATTPSGGCHLYFALPEVPEGMRLGNSNKRLPFKIDIRGDATGYVIVPPSRRTDMGEGTEDGRYRWEKRFSQVGVAPAPQSLLDLLFVPVKGKQAKVASSNPAGTDAAPPSARAPREASGDVEQDAIRKYGLSALDEECRRIRSAGTGARNNQLNESAFSVATLTTSTPYPALDARFARAMIEAAARDNPGDDDDHQLDATISSGWTAGEESPRDLTNVASRARERAMRPHRSSRPASSSPSAPPASTENSKPASQEGGDGSGAGEKGDGGAADGLSGDELTLECARYAMTDLGNLERFLARSGRDFLCVAAWAESSSSPGYVAWDKARWNRSMADALFGRAAQETMRLIQDEAAFIRDSGVPFPPVEGDLPDIEEDDESDEEEPSEDEADPKWFEETMRKRRAKRSAQWYLQRQLARQTKHDGPRHDFIVQVKSNGDIVLFSDKLAAWGRTSEGVGHIECLRKLAPPRLSAKPEEFDSDPLKLNLPNGTLVFHVPEDGRQAYVERRDHSRDDKITKIGKAIYDPDAKCPQFDAFLAQVQPAEDMREWLIRWSGYNALGIADAQVMALFYGEGQNGKGVWVQTHAHILGDYAWATGIETFMDSGFKRNGGGPSPHLAALAGRRMVYANEPEDNSKFSDGLVKALTSDEPIGGVRELYGPAFEMMITFSNTVMANNLPRIGTDYGIRRRMQVVPWSIVVPKEQRDLRLKDKLRTEVSGILNHMIAGALAYLTDGLTMPEAMVEATQSYHDENDILGQFLGRCVVRDPGNTVGATALHDLFAAWQTWAGMLPQSNQPWSKKKLRQEMEKKSFRINKSSTMKWQDIALRFDAIDFVDTDGKPVERDLPEPRHGDKPSAAAPAGAPAPTVDAPPPVARSPLPPSSFDADYVPGFEDDPMPP